METILYNEKEISAIAEALKQGKVIAFPTDTVFGLAVRYDCEAGIIALKKAKHRPDHKPLPMMVGNKQQIQQVAKLNSRIHKLIELWMPGALTLILKKSEDVPDYVTNNEPTIAIRLADDDFILRLIEEVGVPLLVTSANISGEETPIDDIGVMQQLGGSIDGIVQGMSRGSRASTIVDVTVEPFQVVRDGPITLNRILYSLKGIQEDEHENSISE